MRENLTSGLTRGAGASLPLLYHSQKRVPSLRFAQAEKTAQRVVMWILGAVFATLSWFIKRKFKILETSFS
jgi:hypothetical protein